VGGSSNLNHKAWRKASDDFEMITVDTSVERVRELNNRHFSSHWSRLAPDGVGKEQVQIGDWLMTTPFHPYHAHFDGVQEDSSSSLASE
jgi:hypothetical protein